MAALDDVIEGGTADDRGKMGTLDDVIKVGAWAVDDTETIS
jgi:hypothetical protein